MPIGQQVAPPTQQVHVSYKYQVSPKKLKHLTYPEKMSVKSQADIARARLRQDSLKSQSKKMQGSGSKKKVKTVVKKPTNSFKNNEYVHARINSEPLSFLSMHEIKSAAIKHQRVMKTRHSRPEGPPIESKEVPINVAKAPQEAVTSPFEYSNNPAAK